MRSGGLRVCQEQAFSWAPFGNLHTLCMHSGHTCACRVPGLAEEQLSEGTCYNTSNRLPSYTFLIPRAAPAPRQPRRPPQRPVPRSARLLVCCYVQNGAMPEGLSGRGGRSHCHHPRPGSQGSDAAAKQHCCRDAAARAAPRLPAGWGPSDTVGMPAAPAAAAAELGRALLLGALQGASNASSPFMS